MTNFTELKFHFTTESQDWWQQGEKNWGAVVE
jgi:hypothetical protein